MGVMQRRAKKHKQNADKKQLNHITGKYLPLQQERPGRTGGPRENGTAILHVFLEAILALYGVRVERFQPVPPSQELSQLLRRATRRQLQGALVEILGALGDGEK
jgi:hypothetical protein